MLYDALVLPDGEEAITALRADGRTLEFIKDQYRHCKPILALGAGELLLRACGIDAALPDGQPDPGLIAASETSAGADDLVAAIAKIDTSLENRSAARVRTRGCVTQPLRRFKHG